MENIIIVRGDDTGVNGNNFIELLFKNSENINLENIILYIYNSTDIKKEYIVEGTSLNINLDRSVTSTLELGEHIAVLKAKIDNELLTLYNFKIFVISDRSKHIPVYQNNKIELDLNYLTKGDIL